jgi:hypothetical protein
MTLHLPRQTAGLAAKENLSKEPCGAFWRRRLCRFPRTDQQRFWRSDPLRPAPRDGGEQCARSGEIHVDTGPFGPRDLATCLVSRYFHALINPNPRARTGQTAPWRRLPACGRPLRVVLWGPSLDPCVPPWSILRSRQPRLREIPLLGRASIFSRVPSSIRSPLGALSRPICGPRGQGVRQLIVGGGNLARSGPPRCVADEASTLAVGDRFCGVR